jgi:hypothetical protein
VTSKAFALLTQYHTIQAVAVALIQTTDLKIESIFLDNHSVCFWMPINVFVA